MHTLYKAAGPHTSFPSYLSKKLNAPLAEEFSKLVDRFTNFPISWWPQVAAILRPYLLACDLQGAQARLARVFSILDELDKYKLGVWPKPWNLSKAFAALAEEDRKEFSKQSNLATWAFRQVEMIGHQLGIQCIEQSPVTAHTRALLVLHRENTKRIMDNTFRLNGNRRQSLGAITRYQRDRRAAERKAKATGMTEFFTKDCGYVTRALVVVPPSRFHPGYGQTPRQAWIDAGCPNPRLAQDDFVEKFALLRAAFSDLIFYRTAEVYKVGVPHNNGLFFFPTEFDARQFDKQVDRIFRDKDPEPILFKRAGDQRVFCMPADENPVQWFEYIDKNLPQPPKRGEEGGDTQSDDTFGCGG